MCIVLLVLPAQGFAEIDPNKNTPNIYNKEQKLLDTDHFYENKGQINKRFLPEELKELTFKKKESQEMDKFKNNLSFSTISESNTIISQTTGLEMFTSDNQTIFTQEKDNSNRQKQSFQIVIAFGVMIALLLLVMVLLQLLKVEGNKRLGDSGNPDFVQKIRKKI